MRKNDLTAAALSGATMVLIFPGVSLEQLGWCCIVPLLYAVEKKTPREAFWLGCVAGTVFHCGLLYWVTVSMTTYGGLPLPVAVLLLVLFAAFLSMFVALPVFASSYVSLALGPAVARTLPFFWTAAEYIKTWLLTGFPWENLGYSQHGVLPVIQVADITGVYGVTFLLLVVNCAVFSLLRGLLVAKRIPLRDVLAAAVLVGATLAYGYGRLEQSPEGRSDSLSLALVQPNIPQDLKWDPQFLEATTRILTRLTLAVAPAHPDLIIWPESATPFYFQAEEAFQNAVGDAVEETGAYLLLGSPSWEIHQGEPLYFNSAFLVTPERTIAGRYDKTHLVPYGEYVPLQRLFPFVHKMAAGIGDFSPGRMPRNLKLKDGSFATLICYESIFPGIARSFVKQGARFIVNITNDAWFGNTSAPHQHLSMAVLRAVENRRYVARAANTGISAFIRPSGFVYKKTSLFTEAVLPAMIFCRDDITFYTRFGDVFAQACLCGVLLLLVYAGKRSRAARRAHPR